MAIALSLDLDERDFHPPFLHQRLECPECGGEMVVSHARLHTAVLEEHVTHYEYFCGDPRPFLSTSMAIVARLTAGDDLAECTVCETAVVRRDAGRSCWHELRP